MSLSDSRMVKSEIAEMVFMMGKMVENMSKILEELKSLQKNIENRLDQSELEPEEET
jgi:adenylosuccinate lyase